MKNQKSIVGGAVARELLTKVAKGEIGRREINQSSFTARPCERKGRPTGGISASRWTDFPRDFSRAHTARLYIPAARRQHAERLLCHWITTQLRTIAQEKQRIAEVQRLDKLCAPWINDKQFLRWVDRQEKKRGLSLYDTMTIEKAQEWIAAVTAQVQKLTGEHADTRDLLPA